MNVLNGFIGTNSEMFEPPDENELWTPERISRFWDLVAGEPRLHRLYFSCYYAEFIINLARLHGLSGGEVLDYGCGPGFLSTQLIDAGLSVTGLEYSHASAQRVNESLGGRAGWRGCFISEDLDNPRGTVGYDWVFSIEAYEHLRPEWIDGYFKRIFNHLRPGGHLLITVPNNENLDDSLIICPCCEMKFHRWGHLRSVTMESLMRAVEAHGFEVELCHELQLARMINLKISAIDWLLARLVTTKYIRKTMPVSTRERLRAIEKQMRGEESRPHIALIARKVS